MERFPDKKKPQRDFEEMTDFLKKGQELGRKAEIVQKEATWIPPTEYKTPFAVLMDSDEHFGSSKVDYEEMERHYKIVEDTPNFFMSTNGDHTDAFSPSVLPQGMLEDSISPGSQVEIFVEKLKDLDRKAKLAWVNLGNHDDWLTSSGHKPETSLDELEAPVFEHGGKINIQTRGGAKYRGVVAHQYWGKSKLNPTNSPKRLIEYEGGGDADFAVTGHTHQQAFEQYQRGGKDFSVAVLGTRKKAGRFVKNKGIAHESGDPGTTFVFWQDRKKIQIFKDPEDAQQFVLAHAMMEDGNLNPEVVERFKKLFKKE